MLHIVESNFFDVRQKLLIHAKEQPFTGAQEGWYVVLMLQQNHSLFVQSEGQKSEEYDNICKTLKNLSANTRCKLPEIKQFCSSVSNDYLITALSAFPYFLCLYTLTAEVWHWQDLHVSNEAASWHSLKPKACNIKLSRPYCLRVDYNISD